MTARKPTVILSISVLALAALAAPASPGFAQAVARTTATAGDPPPDDGTAVEDPEDTLADLTFVNGVRVVFSHSPSSQDYGLLQKGHGERNAPVVPLPLDSMLDAYLAATPRSLPVPRLLLDEPRDDSAPPPDLRGRTITASPVVARELAVPASASRAATASQAPTCYSGYYWHPDWSDSAIPGRAPKAYYSADFGGKFRYTNSFVYNCTPAGSPSYLYARHRIYYRNALGNYVKQFDSQVPPDDWEAKTKGSVMRYRMAAYSDGWNSDPNCGGGTCKYHREGLFNS
ncbi:hypothetical protein ACWEQG_05050 [Microbispora sp. NPDC004025]